MFARGAGRARGPAASAASIARAHPAACSGMRWLVRVGCGAPGRGGGGRVSCCACRRCRRFGDEGALIVHSHGVGQHHRIRPQARATGG